MATCDVVCIQLDSKNALSVEERDANVAHACAYIRSIREKRSVDDASVKEIYVLNEMVVTGYDNETFNHLDELAEPRVDGPSYRAFSALAKELGIYVLYSYPSQNHAGGKPFITATVVGPDGKEVATYLKTHLCHFGDCSEGTFFSRGTQHGLDSVFEIDGVRFGIMICYDVRFPEVARSLASKGKVDVILHSSAFPKDDASPSWHSFALTRALENQVYVFSVCRAGAHWGGTHLCLPWIDPDDVEAGWPRVFGDDEKFERVRVSKELIERARAKYPLLRDAHPEMWE